MDTRKPTSNPDSASGTTTTPSEPLSPRNLVISEGLAICRELFPSYGQTLTKEATRLYFRLLDDVELEPLRLAWLDAAKTSRSFPTVADIRERAERFAQELPPADAPMLRPPDPDCGRCGGTGYATVAVTVQLDDERGTRRTVDTAAVCKCRRWGREQPQRIGSALDDAGTADRVRAVTARLRASKRPCVQPDPDDTDLADEIQAAADRRAL